MGCCFKIIYTYIAMSHGKNLLWQLNVSDRKHDWGAADLEKVTDYAEEKEIVAASTALLDDAIATVRKSNSVIYFLLQVVNN